MIFRARHPRRGAFHAVLLAVVAVTIAAAVAAQPEARRVVDVDQHPACAGAIDGAMRTALAKRGPIIINPGNHDPDFPCVAEL